MLRLRSLLLLSLLLALCFSGCDGTVTIQDYPSAPECSGNSCPACPATVQSELRYFAASLTRVGDRSEGVAPNLLDLPPELRTDNYAGGSCAHAAIIDILKWHGFEDTAEWWRDNLSGGYSVDEGARQLEQLGFRYAFTVEGDEGLLQWCSDNGHGAAIHYYPAHAITFRGYANGDAILQDNNRPDQVIRVSKETFIKNWKGYGGCALTLVYSPAPPVPYF